MLKRIISVHSKVVEVDFTHQNINYQSASAAEFSHMPHIYSAVSSALTRQSKNRERKSGERTIH